MVVPLEDIIKLLLAILVGGSIGLERELHHKAAGFRTITLICIGAALFTMLDSHLNGSGRIAANIVTGIGFLGGGVILRDTNRIKGLTTAASVWMSAALGMAIGIGAYFHGLIAAVLVLLVMNIFGRLERRIDRILDMRHYEIVLICDPQKVEQLDALMRSCGLKITQTTEMKRNGQLVCTWDASGTTEKQNEFVRQLLADPEIMDIEW